MGTVRRDLLVFVPPTNASPFTKSKSVGGQIEDLAKNVLPGLAAQVRDEYLSEFIREDGTWPTKATRVTDAFARFVEGVSLQAGT
jgi:hypothetical protein